MGTVPDRRAAGWGLAAGLAVLVAGGGAAALVAQGSAGSAPLPRMVISYESGSDGGGWLIANLVSDGAGSYSWKRCPPHRVCTPVASSDQGRTLEAGHAARGSVFVATGVNAAGHASARSLPYRGPVVAVRDAAAVHAPGWTATAAAATVSVLDGVSCLSVSTCTAVGDAGNHAGTRRRTLVERWNGEDWAIQPSPNRSGAVESELQSVSCPAVNWCVAVGSSVVSTLAAPEPLAESWNGVRWSIQRTPPVTASGGSLESVSCASQTSCTSVGYTTLENGERTLVEHWDGESWAIQQSPNRAGAKVSELESVSCATTTTCTAVGQVVGETVGEVAFAEGSNGTRWTIERTSAVGAVSELIGVSCPRKSACVAVGLTGADTPLAERWNGTIWSLEPVPHEPSGAVNRGLSAISCTTPRACTAVGLLVTGNGLEGALAERWNGASWSVQAVPQGIDGSNLAGVACSGDKVCFAVGAVGVGSGGNPGNGAVLVPTALIESWSGTTWTIQRTPTAARKSGEA
jgi:hypothetical protein